MDGNHPNQYDKRPKRRKDKDNPYELFSVGADTPATHYYIRFTDGQGAEHCLEIEKRLFDAFDDFELEDLSHLNEADNHYERSELTEASLNERAFETPPSLEAMVSFKIECDELHSAIRRLPTIQRRRLVLYYFGEMTYEQIAEMEGCIYSSARRSVLSAIENLKKILVRGEHF